MLNTRFTEELYFTECLIKTIHKLMWKHNLYHVNTSERQKKNKKKKKTKKKQQKTNKQNTINLITVFTGTHDKITELQPSKFLLNNVERRDQTNYTIWIQNTTIYRKFKQRNRHLKQGINLQLSSTQSN